jgi:hypothetical protein
MQTQRQLMIEALERSISAVTYSAESLKGTRDNLYREQMKIVSSLKKRLV